MVSEPKYWGTEKGELLRTMVIYGANTISEIESIIHQSTIYLDYEIRKVLEELINERCVSITETGILQVRDDLYEEYTEYDYHIFIHPPPPLEYEIEDHIIEQDIISMTDSWLQIHDLDISLEFEHFFLEGHYLDIYIKFIITKAKNTIILVSPFVDFSTPTKLLIDARRSGKTVAIVTRFPKNERAKYVSKILCEAGITILYYKDIHAKIMIVDDLLSVISSMNFIHRATAGISWEAGIVTTNKKTVDSIKYSIMRLNPEPANQ